MLLLCSAIRADEFGVPFWVSGTYASFAAMPPQSGWSMPVQLYYWSGTGARGESFQHGVTVNLGVSSELAMIFLTPTWAPSGQRWLGGEPSFSLTFGGGWNSTSASVSTTTADGNGTGSVSDSIVGGADLYPQVQITWTRGNNYWMTYVTGDIPTGAYDSNRLSDIGLGHTALDMGGGYTFFNATSGFETSAVLGFTYNGEDSQTNIRSGFDSHLDFEVSQFVSPHLQVGIVGYIYYQLTGDSGSGNRLGPFKSQLAALGPQVGYSFTVFGQQGYVSLRGYWEFWAQNRLAGHAAFLTLNIPLGPGEKTLE